VKNAGAIISGYGLVTPLGQNADSTFDALMCARFITDHHRAAGGADRGVQMARAAGEEAIGRAGWNRDDRSEAGLIVATSKGTLESLITPHHEAIANSPFIAAGGWDRLGLGGPRLVFSAACASGLHALIRGALMIAAGEARRVLVVGYEASVHPLFVGSFNRLGIIAPAGEVCRPFDQTRSGFLVSEAAAAVCLQADGGGEIRLENFAMGGDATHLTGGDPHGCTLRRMLCGLIGETKLDLIHAHGTGTEFNDPVELAAIEAAAPRQSVRPAVYSHKGAIGHSLGAAGLIAVVINCMCHQRSVIPPNVQTLRPLETSAISINAAAIDRRIDRSLAMAAGFGGAMAAAVLWG